MINSMPIVNLYPQQGQVGHRHQQSWSQHLGGTTLRRQEPPQLGVTVYLNDNSRAHVVALGPRALKHDSYENSIRFNWALTFTIAIDYDGNQKPQLPENLVTSPFSSFLTIEVLLFKSRVALLHCSCFSLGPCVKFTDQYFMPVQDIKLLILWWLTLMED